MSFPPKKTVSISKHNSPSEVWTAGTKESSAAGNAFHITLANSDSNLNQAWLFKGSEDDKVISILSIQRDNDEFLALTYSPALPQKLWLKPYSPRDVSQLFEINSTTLNTVTFRTVEDRTQFVILDPATNDKITVSSTSSATWQYKTS